MKLSSGANGPEPVPAATVNSFDRSPDKYSQTEAGSPPIAPVIIVAACLFGAHLYLGERIRTKQPLPFGEILNPKS
jgi:hypothetical protein